MAVPDFLAAHRPSSVLKHLYEKHPTEELTQDLDLHVRPGPLLTSAAQRCSGQSNVSFDQRRQTAATLVRDV